MLDQQLLGKAHSKVKNAVSDIQKKYLAIKRLEKSVYEVYELQQELATLVEAQGEKLDSIEAHWRDTNDYLEKAEQHLDKTKEIEEQSRDTMCWVMLGLGTVGVVVMSACLILN